MADRAQNTTILNSTVIFCGASRRGELRVTYTNLIHRLHGHRDVGVRRDEDDRQLPVRRGKLALKLKTASPRHSHVEHQASRTVRRLGIQEIGNGRKLLGIQADRAQQTPNQVAKLGIVIDDQDAGVRVRHPRTLRKGSAFFPLEWPSFYSQSVDMNSPLCLSG